MLHFALQMFHARNACKMPLLASYRRPTQALSITQVVEMHYTIQLKIPFKQVERVLNCLRCYWLCYNRSFVGFLKLQSVCSTLHTHKKKKKKKISIVRSPQIARLGDKRKPMHLIFFFSLIPEKAIPPELYSGQLCVARIYPMA